MRNVTLKQLRALSETVKAGTLAGAAEVLNVTPPAVSLQINQLKEQLGIPLLQKSESGFLPTAAATELVEVARQIEAVLTAGQDAIDAIKTGRGGVVRIGVVSTAKYFAPRLLAAFRDTHPLIDIQLAVGNRTETIAALEAFELDFAIMGRPPRQFKVEQATIGPHPHVVIAPVDHPLADKASVSRDMLGNETFLMREQGSGTRMLTEWLLNELQANPTAGIELGSNETIKQAVMAGLGIALISAHTVALELQGGRLKILNVEGLPIIRTWFAVRRSDKQMLAPANSLWDFIVRDGKHYLP